MNATSYASEHLSNRRMSDPRLTDVRVSDPRLADVTDPRLLDAHRVSDARACLPNREIKPDTLDYSLSDVQMPDASMPDARMSDANMSDARMPDVRVPDVNMADHRMPSEDGLPDVRVIDMSDMVAVLPDCNAPNRYSPVCFSHMLLFNTHTHPLCTPIT